PRSRTNLAMVPRAIAATSRRDCDGSDLGRTRGPGPSRAGPLRTPTAPRHGKGGNLTAILVALVPHVKTGIGRRSGAMPLSHHTVSPAISRAESWAPSPGGFAR